MYKKYLLLDSGYIWLNVIELKSNEKIELSHELLENVTAQCIHNEIGISYIKDDHDALEYKNEYDEIDGYIYLDLSSSNIGYNVYLNILNCKMLDTIPDTYNINLSIEV